MEYIIKTPCGELRGVRTRLDGVVAYKGIRYATAGRFEYPVEVTSWEGVYDATEYGACAPQPRSFYDEEQMPKKIFYYNEFRKGEKYSYSEDCLFLNVFAPEKADGKLPVIVYIHGGGYTGGCGHEKHFDTPVWPRKGVIGVTLNYRLGPLGFAVLPELMEEAGTVGNYGLYDQLTAIKWVKHNIEAFGGDPDNITIMGQSAGAMSVQQHCLSPLSRGLFHKAVMSSGGGVSRMLSASAPEKHYEFWKMIMDKCGAKNLDELRALPVEKLFTVWQENKKMSMGGGCSPCIDGKLVVKSGYDTLAAGEQHQIPYMIGTTSHDVMPPILYSMAKSWCKAQKTPAYLWFFNRNLPGDNHGAWHSADLWYWFGTLENGWRPFDERDYALAEEMSERLCAFAKTASPNTDVHTEWSEGGERALVMGDEPSKEANPSKFKLWVTMFTNKAPGE
ncbi:MAG: carboxylesterase family protein [Clostridia bacterium]|nr:carboxylesterase family protein [Clostridia bacterium]